MAQDNETKFYWETCSQKEYAEEYALKFIGIRGIAQFTGGLIGTGLYWYWSLRLDFWPFGE